MDAQKFSEQKYVFFGAGSAGLGIAELITQVIKNEGLSREEAKKRIFILGRNGLVHSKSKDLDDLKKEFAQPVENISSWDISDLNSISLLEVIQNVRPTVLIGTSTQRGSFTEQHIKEMYKHVKRPIIFPLSNPTSKVEALPSDLIKWTNGNALIAAGSPFEDVSFEQKKFQIGQCNNVFIFPGVGLGVIASKAQYVTDNMFIIAAKVLSNYAPIATDPNGSLFPKLDKLREISKEIAIAVYKEAISCDISCNSSLDAETEVNKIMWNPAYPQISKILAEKFTTQLTSR